jgi:hypothetical protein
MIKSDPKGEEAGSPALILGGEQEWQSIMNHQEPETSKRKSDTFHSILSGH